MFPKEMFLKFAFFLNKRFVHRSFNWLRFVKVIKMCEMHQQNGTLCCEMPSMRFHNFVDAPRLQLFETFELIPN